VTVTAGKPQKFRTDFDEIFMGDTGQKQKHLNFEHHHGTESSHDPN